MLPPPPPHEDVSRSAGAANVKYSNMLNMTLYRWLGQPRSMVKEDGLDSVFHGVYKGQTKALREMEGKFSTKVIVGLLVLMFGTPSDEADG